MIKKALPLSVLVVMAIAGIAALLALAAPAAAQHHHDGNHQGTFIPHLPNGYHPMHFRNERYFFHHGSFYHPYRSGFMVVTPPFGAMIDLLPDNYTIVHFGGRPYYYCDGVYFDYLPAEKVYVVVDKPSDAKPGALVYDFMTLTDGTHLDGTYVGGTKSVVQFEVNGEIREIARDKIISIQFSQPKQE